MELRLAANNWYSFAFVGSICLVFDWLSFRYFHIIGDVLHLFAMWVCLVCCIYYNGFSLVHIFVHLCFKQNCPFGAFRQPWHVACHSRSRLLQ